MRFSLRKPKSRPLLLDAEVAQRAAPLSFVIPSRVSRESLHPGDVVKLLFSIDPPQGWVKAERMWVKVTATRAGAYRGRLDNDPAYLQALRAGDELEFGPEHVVALWNGTKDEGAPADDAWPFDQAPNAAAVVTKGVLEGRPILLVSHDADDEGWQFLDGDTPDESEARIISMAQVLEHDPSLSSVAGLPPGWRASRASALDPWKPEPDSSSVG